MASPCSSSLLACLLTVPAPQATMVKAQRGRWTAPARDIGGPAGAWQGQPREAVQLGGQGMSGMCMGAQHSRLPGWVWLPWQPCLPQHGGRPLCTNWKDSELVERAVRAGLYGALTSHVGALPGTENLCTCNQGGLRAPPP